MKSLVKSVVTTGVAIWSTVHETAMGGFTLDVTGLTLDSVLPPGTPIAFDESTRIAKVVKIATLHANATNTATDYEVEKGHDFKVGEYFAAVIGGKAYAITAIDKTTNTTHDVITVGTTLAVALTAGAGLFQSSATGATAAAFYGGTVKGLLYDETTVEAGVSVSVVLVGTLYARRVPGLNNSYLQAALPRIIFSQSY